MKISGWRIFAALGLMGILAISPSLNSYVSFGAEDSPIESLSNGLIKIDIDSRSGTYDLMDVKSGEMLFENAAVAATTAPCRELEEIKEGDSEAAGPEQNYRSPSGQNRIAANSYTGVFGTGKALTLICTFSQKAEIAVRFVVYPELPFLDIGWTFRNLSQNPIRLRRLSALFTDRIFPEQNPAF